jgi:hypothetical protein
LETGDVLPGNPPRFAARENAKYPPSPRQNSQKTPTQTVKTTEAMGLGFLFIGKFW